MKHSILDVLRVKPFSYLLASELFTQLGSNIFSFYLILVVFALTGSNTAVAGIILSFTIPAILFGIPAGVYVDRWNKKTVLFVTNILRAILLVCLFFFHANILAIFILSFLIAIMAQFFIPAESPMIPLLVHKKLLLHANALFGFGIYGSILLAFILSGPIILFFGRDKTPLFLAFLFVVSSLFVWLIKHVKSVKIDLPENMGRAMRDEIKDVLSLLSNTKEMHHTLFLLALSQVLILIIAALAPGYATQVLRVAIEDFPLLFIAPAACGVLIGVMLVSLLHVVKKETIITIGLFLSSFAMLVLPYGSAIASKTLAMSLNHFLPAFLNITTNHIVTFLAFLLGFANAFVFVPSNTILQEKTTDEMRGKVYGVLNTVVGVFSLVPLLLAGGLSDLLGVMTVVTGIGLSLLGLSISRVVFRI